MINYDFIYTILAQYEGKAYTRGYIPCDGGTWFGGLDPYKGEPQGASGVTIATGVDLGQQTRVGLKSMGVSDETLAILDPYIGLQKKSAMQKLKEAPLAITPERVKEIDDAVHEHYIMGTALKFGRENFEAAPKEVQAVAVSLCYQFGTPFRAVSPGLGLAWEALRVDNYKEAALHLANPKGWSVDHQKYLSRRRQEAMLLNAIG